MLVGIMCIALKCSLKSSMVQIHHFHNGPSNLLWLNDSQFNLVEKQSIGISNCIYSD